jgi:FkbH-like protein
MMKTAILSNINMDSLIRSLAKEEGMECYASRGYGNELGTLLNTESDLYSFGPDAVFLIMDLAELLGHEFETGTAAAKVKAWFGDFTVAVKPGITYFISDAYLYAPEILTMNEDGLRTELEHLWLTEARKLTSAYPNVHLIAYNKIIRSLGEKAAFSPKMWYMGKILHSVECQKALKEEILYCLHALFDPPKKVLLTDLDNTLWKGLAGENNITPVGLSEDGVGLTYKNFQRVLKVMQGQGVILGIISKNNEADAMEIIDHHPHMVLRRADFAVLKINWENKAENIKRIAEELNLGTDSFVFLDDSPAERMLIKEALPEVIVPDLPERPEDLADFAVELNRKYFARVSVTEEDRAKTEQYRANRERESLKEQATDFASYLRKMDIRLIREEPKQNAERLGQLVNKTNQFNLTTKRYSEKELAELLEDEKREIFLYRVTDVFGDNGIVGVAVLAYGEAAEIEELTLSCRVMGRLIENAVIEDLEKAAADRGYTKIVGKYIPTEKNFPVENLYPSLGYAEEGREGETIIYALNPANAPAREYYLTREKK